MPGKAKKIVPAVGNPFESCAGARYILAILGCIAMGIVYGLKVNLSVAIVGMVNHTALELTHGPTDHKHAGSSDDDCGGKDSGNTTDSQEDGPFEWGGGIQGAMLSSYFWGYIVAQLPGGRIAETFSAKWVMFFAVAINVVCTLLTPITAKLHFGAMIAMRILEGVGGGVTFPGMHVMLANWAPPSERSVMSSIVYAGTALGTVISMLLAGVIAANLGWEMVFYIMGGTSSIWLILWGVWAADSPEEQRFITEKERDMIVTSLNKGPKGEKKAKVPWKAVLTSMPFYAILVAHTCSNWGWYMVLIELPMYMKQVLKFKIAENAVLTAAPFLCMWVFSLILSKTLDTLRSKGKITTTTARKTGTIIASAIPLACFVALCYIGCQRVIAVTLMTIAITSVGGMFSGFLANHIDLSPNYAGTLMAITNTMATIPGIVVPVFVGKLTHDNPTIGSWRIIFWVTIALYAVEIIMYTIFGSGNEQSWNKPDKTADESQPLKPTTPATTTS